jgi:hypothetical protein
MVIIDMLAIRPEHLPEFFPGHHTAGAFEQTSENPGSPFGHGKTVAVPP